VIPKVDLESCWSERTSNLFKVDSTSGEEWKKTERKSCFSDPIIFNSESSELPSPLYFINTRLYFNLGKFSQDFELSFRDSSILDKLSSLFDKTLRKYKKRFIPTTPDLTGYIVNPDDEICATLTEDNSSDKESRILSFGCYGCKPLECSTFSSFYADVGEHNNEASQLIKFILNKSKNNSCNIPHLELYLTHFDFH